MSPVAYRDVAAAFGAVLKTARAGAGVTQEKLAELADIDRTYPSLLERGRREPGLGVVIRLGEALQAPFTTALPGAVSNPLPISPHSYVLTWLAIRPSHRMSWRY